MLSDTCYTVIYIAAIVLLVFITIVKNGTCLIKEIYFVRNYFGFQF